MKKNVGSQIIGAELITAADGTAFTGSVTCYYTIDGGSQTLGSVGSGVCTHEGNGYHTYTPTAGETNGNHIAWTFIGTGAVPVTIQLYTSFPQTGDVAIVATEGRLAELDAANLPADIANLNNFDPANDTVALVTAITNDVGITQAGADKVWGSAARTLTSFGTLIADIWASATRSLTDKAGFTISGTKTTLDALNDVAATDIVSAGAITTFAGAVVNVDTVDTCTTNTDMRGTDGANTVVPDAAGTAPTAVEIRQEVDTNSADLDTLIANLSTVAGYLDTEIAAIKAVTDLLPDGGALTTLQADAARLTAARAQVLTDWIDGGRLDLILDELTVQGDTNESKVDTLDTVADGIQTDLDNATDGLGALKTLIEAVTPTTVITPASGALEINYVENAPKMEVVKGDKVGLAFSFTGDMTGNTLFFGVKKNYSSGTYEIGDDIGGAAEFKILGWSVAAGVTSGTINLTAAQTSLKPGIYKAEIEKRDADEISNPATPYKFDLEIVGSVIN